MDKTSSISYSDSSVHEIGASLPIYVLKEFTGGEPSCDAMMQEKHSFDSFVSTSHFRGSILGNSKGLLPDKKAFVGH
jgi:hypothetical protein